MRTDPIGSLSAVRWTRPAQVVRLALYALAFGLVGPTVCTAAGWTTADDPRLRSLFVAGALAGAGASLLTVLSSSRSSGRGRCFSRALDLAVFNSMGALLVGELVFRLLQHAAPTQILWDDSSPAANVLARRHCPEPYRFRYRCNHAGYLDEEFFEPGPDDYVVALLADSFGVGMVPAPHLFVTLAERELRDALDGRYERVAIHNFAVAGIDLPEYRYLLDTEILGRPFAQVVLCLFVGNDLGDVEPPGQTTLSKLLRVQGWLGPTVAWRAWRVLRGTEPPDSADGAELPEEPAFLRDPSLEPPSFTEDEFQEIELDRVRYTLTRGRASELVYRQAFAQLDYFHDRLGSRLLLVLIPDEYQVNDALWERLLTPAARKYAPALAADQGRAALDREYPQRRLRAWAAARGVRLLDLLSPLRDAEREGQTYHLRDTHWNAHGNRVAARELARALLAQAEVAPRRASAPP